MKRFTTLSLALMLIVLFAITPATAEPITANGSDLPAVTLLTSPDTPIQDEEDVSTDAQPESESVPAPTTPTQQLGDALVHQDSSNEAIRLRFDQLRSTLLKYNLSVRSLQASLDEVSQVSVSSIEQAIEQLQVLNQTITSTLGRVNSALASPDLTQEQTLVYTALSVSLSTDAASLQSQITSLRSQADSLQHTKETTKFSINDGINKIVKGAETLYVGIITMDSALGDLDRGLTSLERTVKLFETQYERGMISLYDLEGMQYQLRMLQSQKESLAFQLKTSKMTLEGMCGMERRGTVGLATLTMPTADELSSVDYDKYVKVATQRNADVLIADAKRFNGTTAVSAEDSYRSAVDSFAGSFRTICLTVGEQNRLAQTAQDTVDYQQRTFEIADKKYQLGMLSHEEYLAAQNELENAKSALHRAQLDLFSAYRNYIWAKDYGVV